MRHFIATLGILCVVTMMNSCGRNGGDAGSPAATPAAATVKLNFSGTTPVYGIVATVVLPAGVTLKSTANPPQTDSEVVIASGATVTNTLVAATYTAATNSSAAAARVVIVNANGFSAGEFCTVNADIAAGSAPTASDFTLENFAASDSEGAVISGITPSYTVTTR